MTNQTTQGVAKDIARVATDFELRRTGRAPQSITVVVAHDTVVITVHDALSPAEKALSKNPAGAAQVQELHRRLFDGSCDSLREEIKRITGVDVREASIEVDTAGAVVQAFKSGTVVQVFLLAESVATDTWFGNAADGQP